MRKVIMAPTQTGLTAAQISLMKMLKDDAIIRVIVARPRYTINNLTIKELVHPFLEAGQPTGKPPQGRSKRQHDFIVGLNKRGRG